MEMMERCVNTAIDNIAALSGELGGEAEAMRESLTAPPRVVVVGRLKAGKSTLVNALIGAPVSETAALEATNVVTVFQYGAPDRAEAVLKDGSRIPITTMRGQKTELPVPANTIAYVNRWITSSAVRDYSLIDTPGLATLTESNEGATRAALLDEQTRSASVEADAAIFLFDSVPRRDEVDFLHELGFTPLNTLGILSRADSFGEGALGTKDPLVHAAEYSGILQEGLADYLPTVMPVAGLLAETAYTGRVNEAMARALAQYQSVGIPELLTSLVAPDSPMKKTAMQLMGSVGEYGFIKGRDVAQQGGAELSDWLVEKSNLNSVREYLLETLTPFAQLHRAGRVVRTMESLAYRYGDHRNEIRSIVSRLKKDPRMISVMLFQDLKSLLEVDAQDELLQEVIRMIKGRSYGQKLGLSRFASGYDILEAVRQRKAWLSGLSLTFLSAAEEAAIFNLNRIYVELENAGEALT